MIKQKISYGFFIFTVLFVAQTFSQTLDVRKGSFFFPRPYEKEEFAHEFAVILAKLPEDQIEATSSWIYSPLFIYKAKYGLGKGFNITGQANTNIISFLFDAGAQWNYSLNRFSFGVGSSINYWFGALHQFGFDSKVKSWSGRTDLFVGYASENFTVTIAGEINYIFGIKQKADDIITSDKGTNFNGGSIAFLIEQPAWKDKFMTLGVKMNWVKLYWPAWAVFPSWDKYFFIPEVFVGFVL
jgi:hypothetical protein